MGNDKNYYDYSNYYNENSFEVTSVHPGMMLLLGTTGYTAVCILIGFMFKCRKKKWRKQEAAQKEAETARQHEREEESTSANGPAWLSNVQVDASAYMCAVDEVIDNTFFEDSHQRDSDGASIDSNDSSKAYEYLFGADGNVHSRDGDEGGAIADMNNMQTNDVSYELFEEGESRGRGKMTSKSNHVERRSSSDTCSSSNSSQMRSKSPLEGSEVIIDISPKLSEGKKLSPGISIKDQEKKVEVRRFLFGRKNRVKKREKKTVKKKMSCVPRTSSRFVTVDRVFHSPNNLEIELKETFMSEWSEQNNPERLHESYEHYHEYEDPIEVDKRMCPELNGRRDDMSGEDDDTYEKEMGEIMKLAIPWTLTSFISYFASIVAIALISNFMSVAEMICYSYVWFILEAAFILSSALYNSLYKHVNNSIATETEEGYFKAGKYIRIGIIVNFVLSVPISIGMVFGMGSVFRLYGFGDQMVRLCHKYTIVAVIHNFTSTTSSFITLTTDIDGYADFNAKYSFIDTLVDIGLSVFVIPIFRPTLLQLGLIHYAHDIISTAVYYYLTWYKYGWFDLYKEGIRTPLTYDRKDKKALATLVKKAIPMSFDELNGELEWLVSAYFASYLGHADSASWILLSYIWGLIGVVPSCIGSAAEYRVSNQLSKGNITLAQQLSSRCMFLTATTSFVGTGIMFLVRHPLIKIIATDYHLADMLIKVVPYLVLCQPLISLTTTGAYLNRALAMYQRSTKIELLITCLVTIPAAWISTFHFGWDVCGLTAAAFVGYATMGAVILAIYNNADWEKAVRKNRKMAGLVETSKLDTSVDTLGTQNISFDSDKGVLPVIDSNDTDISFETEDREGVLV